MPLRLMEENDLGLLKYSLEFIEEKKNEWGKNCLAYKIDA